MATDRSIPSLDGLRALSVILVILSHNHSLWAGHSEDFLYPLRDGSLGVSIFFVISGFLITHLLLREDLKTGKIDMGRFYIRRAFRIFPPFYFFLAVVGIRSLMHIEPITVGSYLSAAFYVWNYNIHATGAILGHLWSLSLEEQFYLLWPMCLFLFRKRVSLQIAIASLLLSPVIRVAFYFLTPAYRGHMGMMLHTRIDNLMVGCILAIALDLGVWPNFIRWLNRPWIAGAAAIYVFLINGFLTKELHGMWTLAAGISISNVCITVIVLYVTSHPTNAVGIVLNNPVIRHIGMISYGIYLWQQLFAFDEPYSTFPWNCILILACAELSYFLVEKPSYYLRDRIPKRPEAARKPALIDADHVETCPVETV